MWAGRAATTLKLASSSAPSRTGTDTALTSAWVRAALTTCGDGGRMWRTPDTSSAGALQIEGSYQEELSLVGRRRSWAMLLRFQELATDVCDGKKAGRLYHVSFQEVPYRRMRQSTEGSGRHSSRIEVLLDDTLA